jgi:hypothetical protein
LTTLQGRITISLSLTATKRRKKSLSRKAAFSLSAQISEVLVLSFPLSFSCP